MIKAIKEIQNLGKFEKVDYDIPICKNSLIFGFNGTGKSTLSDMFYSLSQQNSFSLNEARTTLKRDASDMKKIAIRIQTDENDATYSDGKWDSSLNVLTFNDRYTEEYVMSADKFNHNVLAITITKEARQLVKKQDYLNEKMDKEYMPIMKECLFNKSSIFKNIKKIGEVKSLTKRSINKITALSEIKLLSDIEQQKVHEELINESIFVCKVQVIEKAQELYSQIPYRNSSELFRAGALERLLQKIPRASSQMIYKHMAEYLKSNNVTWLLSGYYNQKDREKCPYCGQVMNTDYTRQFSKEIERFTTMKSMESAKEIKRKLEESISGFNAKKIIESINTYNNIIEKLLSENILTKAERDLYFLQIEVNSISNEINEILHLLWQKNDNIFEKYMLSQKHKDVIGNVNRILLRINSLDNLLQVLKEKYEKKLLGDTQQKEKGALLLLSSAENRDEVIESIKCAKLYLGAKKEIEDININLDDISGNIRTDRINYYLKELNVKYSVYMKNRRFYVKLKDFLPEEYSNQTSKNNLFSDGEVRALAFAYFMSEVEAQSVEKTIVLDDPISSLDLNRKCIMAYLINELMNKDENQVIILTHDITFIERINSYYNNPNIVLQKSELVNSDKIIRELELEEYLKTDEGVYQSLIENAANSNEVSDIILGLMSLRPYCEVKKCSSEVYANIEKRTTYFTHTLYAHNTHTKFNRRYYNLSGMRGLIKFINKELKSSFDEKRIIDDGFIFDGFDYELLSQIYLDIDLDTVMNARKKALVMRPLLEACLVKLVKKNKVDPLHVGDVYNSATRNGDKTIKQYAKKLQELYKITCKYHHGMESGSSLGISWINADEIEYMDRELQDIMVYIDDRERKEQSA